MSKIEPALTRAIRREFACGRSLQFAQPRSVPTAYRPLGVRLVAIVVELVLCAASRARFLCPLICMQSSAVRMRVAMDLGVRRERANTETAVAATRRRRICRVAWTRVAAC
jgi:hypothetical protein